METENVLERSVENIKLELRGPDLARERGMLRAPVCHEWRLNVWPRIR